MAALDVPPERPGSSASTEGVRRSHEGSSLSSHRRPEPPRAVVLALSLPRTLTATVRAQQQPEAAPSESLSPSSSSPHASSTWWEGLWTGLKRFTAGAVAGVAECLVGHPLDTLKVRMQTIAVTASSAGSSAAAAAAAAAAGGGEASALRLLTSTVRNEGFLALYRGASSRVVGSAVGNSVLFGTNGEFKRLFGADSSRPLSGPFLLAAACTGLAEALVFTPIDLVKTRCQVQYGREAALAPWAVAKQLVREQGVLRGLFTGAGPTMLRDGLGNMCYFAAYELTKRSLLARDAGQVYGETPVFVVSGGVAGCAYWAGILPIDTVKSIVQSQKGPAKSGWSVAVGLFKSGGVPAFYKGLGPALLRAFPTSASTFVTYEYMLRFLDQL